MRKFLLAAAGVAALLGVAAGAASAQDQQRPRGVFAMDANTDGVVTRQEFDAARATRFAALDADNNGQVTREEMRNQRGERRGERRRHRDGHGMHHLARADANNDGAITREEFLARPTQMFARLDANSDGVITADERPQRRQRAEGERRERPSFDANNDRQISRSEWDQMGAAMFQRLDADSDGRVTQAEAQNARGHRRGH